MLFKNNHSSRVEKLSALNIHCCLMVELSQWASSLELYINIGFVYKISDYQSGKQEKLAKILFSF